MQVKIKPRALSDLAAVKAWGINNWGEARAREFLEGLVDAIERLAQFPNLGRARPALHPDLRSVLYRGYVIFYTIEDDTSVVIAVLHERRNQAALDFTDRMDK